MKQYLDLLRYVMKHGTEKTDRTGTGTKSIFGYQMRFDLGEGFPMLTTKKLHWKSIAHELLWFLSGSTNIKYLKDNGVKIWDAWADADGELGPVYGKQWRRWEGPAVWKDGRDFATNKLTPGEGDYHEGKIIDQIAQVVKQIKETPDSRRMIVSAWNVGEIDDMALPPCHCLFQFYVADGKLSCQLYQRSADIFLGVPFNIASYALLTHMIANTCGLKAGEFIHTLGDAHIYSNHYEQVKEQLTRTPKSLPALSVCFPKDIFDYTYDDFLLVNYNADANIKAPIAV